MLRVLDFYVRIDHMISQAANDRVQRLALTSGMMGADFSVVGFLGGFSVWDMYLCTMPIVARLLTIGDGGFPNAVCAGRKVSSNTVKPHKDHGA